MWSWFLARLKGILNFFASLIIFVILVSVISGLVGSFAQPKIPSDVVLSFDMRSALPDSPPNSLFSEPNTVRSVIDAVAALAAAENDSRVKGMILRVGGAGIAPAQAQELRAAVKAFRAKGKFVIAHAQSFGASSMGDYVLASAADEIWLQYTSSLDSTGVASTAIFLRSMLDKINAQPHFEQRYEYKNAANMFIEKDFTPAHREATTRYLESMFDTQAALIAADRKKTKDEIVALINSAPYLTREAIDKKLIDKQGFDDDAEDAALARAGEKAEIQTLNEYFKIAGNPWKNYGKPTIAFIHGDGQINDGESEDDFGGSSSMGGDTLAQAFRDATEDEDVKAIIFRVNSPGGSALASDQILDAIKKAQKSGKKVVVSMGEVAASGGYYVSLSANRIFAHESTITGSIGVLSGKIVTAGSFALLGIDMKSIGVGTNSLMQADTQPFTPDQLLKFRQGVDAIYADFTKKVAEGRGLPLEKVLEIAKGRVWTGADAQQIGLVDKFGGFRAALEETKALAGIPADSEINLRSFPGEKSVEEKIADLFGTSASAVRTISLIGKIMGTEPVAEMTKALQMHANDNEAPQTLMPQQKTR